MDHQDVDAAVAEMLRVLGSHTGEDWTVPAGPLEWTCWQTAAHIVHDLLAYAGQLAAQPADAYLPFDLNVRPTASPSEVLQAVTACGGLLSSALAAASPALRAWHWGPCDPEGFAAMGVAEVLLHTDDITQGLSVDWLPPPRPETPPGYFSGAPAAGSSTASPAKPHGGGKQRDRTDRADAVEPSRSQHQAGQGRDHRDERPRPVPGPPGQCNLLTAVLVVFLNAATGAFLKSPICPHCTTVTVLPSRPTESRAMSVAPQDVSVCRPRTRAPSSTGSLP